MKPELYYFIFTFVIVLYLFHIFMGTRFIYYKDYSGLRIKPIYWDNIKSGDIFLVAYDKKIMFPLESIGGLNFHHTAVAVWEYDNDKKDKLFIIEYAAYERRETDEYNGIIKIPASKWFRLNRKTLILRNEIDISPEEEKTLSDKIMKYYEESKWDGSLGGFNINWFRFLFPSDKYRKPVIGKNNLICIEYTVALLNETDITQKEKSLEYYSPQDFIGMKGFKTNYKYDKHIVDIHTLAHVID